MNNQPKIERRKCPRVSNNVPLKIFSPDADLVTETKNISCSGAYCRINRYLEPMTKLKVVLLLPVRKNGKVTAKKVSCGGVVVRTENILNEEGFNTAIFFNDIKPRDTRIIAEFVDSVISDQTARTQV
ncbi:MAG: PilZ domain-containing protein [Candidatus Omnitrophica bacterium]|nr:PilZ domain-containing protein [Candidatus Omnitrophota bacterium]